MPRLRDLLCLPRNNRRARSKARSESDAVGDPSEVGLTAPRPAESNPDLGIGLSISPKSVPSTSQNRESNSM